MLSRSEDLDWKANVVYRTSIRRKIGFMRNVVHKTQIGSKLHGRKRMPNENCQLGFGDPKPVRDVVPPCRPKVWKKLLSHSWRTRKCMAKWEYPFLGLRLARTAIRNDLLFFLCAQKCWQIQSELCKTECCPKSWSYKTYEKTVVASRTNSATCNNCLLAEQNLLQASTMYDRLSSTSSFDKLRYDWKSAQCFNNECYERTSCATNEQAVLRLQEKVFLWSNKLDPIYLDVKCDLLSEKITSHFKRGMYTAHWYWLTNVWHCFDVHVFL